MAEPKSIADEMKLADDYLASVEACLKDLMGMNPQVLSFGQTTRIHIQIENVRDVRAVLKQVESRIYTAGGM